MRTGYTLIAFALTAQVSAVMNRFVAVNEPDGNATITAAVVALGVWLALKANQTNV